MGLWDKVRDWFGINKKEQNEADTTPYKEKEKELIDKLGAMDNEYRESVKQPSIAELIPEKPDYKELEYKAESDNDIENKTVSKYEQNKVVDVANIEQDYNKKATDINNSVQKYKDNTESQMDKLNEIFGENKEKYTNSAIKNGLARSSIHTQGLEQLDTDFESQKSYVNEQLEQKLNEFGTKLKDLENMQNLALQKLDLSYADKIEKEIANLKSQRQKQIEQIEKYNNTIKEKTENYIKNRQQTIEKELSDNMKKSIEQEENELKYGYTGDKKVNYDQRLNMSLDFYKNMPKEVAVQMVKDNSYLKTYLGHNYGKLISALA